MSKTQRDLRRSFTVVINPEITIKNHTKWKSIAIDGGIDALARHTMQVGDFVNRNVNATGVSVVARFGSYGLLQVSAQSNNGGQRALVRAFKGVSCAFISGYDASKTNAAKMLNGSLLGCDGIIMRNAVVRHGKTLG